MQRDTNKRLHAHIVHAISVSDEPLPGSSVKLPASLPYVQNEESLRAKGYGYGGLWWGAAAGDFRERFGELWSGLVSGLGSTECGCKSSL